MTCLLASASLGCASIPKGAAAVDTVSIEGNDALDEDDVADKLATTPSPKFLGLFRGVVYDYQLFDAHVLERDLKRVERAYRARGYYEAHARAGRIVYTSDKHVDVTIEVEEGRVVTTGRVYVLGLEGVDAEASAAVDRAVERHVAHGKPFDEEEFKKAEEAVKRALGDRGHAYVNVTRVADVDLPRHAGTLAFRVEPGPRCRFGEVHVEGLGKLPEAPVRVAIDIKPGEPYSAALVASAQQAVLDLGAFSSVEITPDLSAPPSEDCHVPLNVKVQPQRLHTVLLGGGLELDAIKTEIHGHVGWEHKNLFGGFRHFQVDLQPGVDLYPTRLPDFAPPTQLLPEEKLRVELRQPGFVEARTEGFIRGEANVYPVLLTPDVDPAAPVLGYLEFKGAAGVGRGFHKLRLTLSYDFQYDEPFAYVGTKDSDLRMIVVSSIDLLGQLDFRNDKIKPHEGVYLQNDLQVAGGPLFGTGADVRVQPEARGYIPLGRRVTLASRATVGLLFPFNYAKTLTENAGQLPSDAERAEWVKDLELMYLRGFFSGGPSSNRGYPLQGVGPHGIVPFLNPGVAAQQLAQSCTDITDPAQAAVCAVPLGGQTLWEASIELRVTIAGPFGGVAFCDSSDVELDRATFKFNHLHLSCGLGARYETPIGPVRVDVGYRIPGMQIVGETPDVALEGDPGTVFGAPIAFAFGIGETF
jgi:outer membrane protein insertion porin family/translocation and assembly module TamA